MGSFTFSDRFITTTAFHHSKRIVNMQDLSHRFLTDMQKMGRENMDGGHQLSVTWATQRHSVTTQLSSGYEPIDMNVKPIVTPGFQGLFYAQRPVLISVRDEDQNSGKAQMIKLIEGRIKDSELGLRAQFEQQTLRGDVASMSDLITWNGFDFTTGFFERTAVGAQSNTVHGVSKLTFATLPHFQNQRGQVSPFSTSGLTTMFAAETDIDDILTDEMSPSRMGYFSKAGINNYKRAVGINEIYQIGSSPLDGGVRPVKFGSYEMRTTSRLPNAGSDTVNFPWTAVFADFAMNKFVMMKQKWFKLSKFKEVSGHDVRAAFYSIFGQNRTEAFGSTFIGFSTAGEPF